MLQLFLEVAMILPSKGLSYIHGKTNSHDMVWQKLLISINFQNIFQFSCQGEMIHVAKFVKKMKEKTGLVVMLAVNISMPAVSM